MQMLLMTKALSLHAGNSESLAESLKHIVAYASSLYYHVTTQFSHWPFLLQQQKRKCTVLPDRVSAHHVTMQSWLVCKSYGWCLK